MTGEDIWDVAEGKIVEVNRRDQRFEIVETEKEKRLKAVQNNRVFIERQLPQEIQDKYGQNQNKSRSRSRSKSREYNSRKRRHSSSREPQPSTDVSVTSPVSPASSITTSQQSPVAVIKVPVLASSELEEGEEIE